MRLTLALVLACGGSASTPPAAPPSPPPPTDPITPALNPTSPELPPKRTGPRKPIVTTAPSPLTDPAALPSPDPAEPTEPAAECSFTRHVHCVNDAVGTCPLAHAPFSQDNLIRADAGYSAAETRAARKSDPHACCYVEFVTWACD